MAAAEDYAKWIVENQNKKGTPEFETVASAYRLARGESQKDAGPKTGSPGWNQSDLSRSAGLAVRSAGPVAAGAAVGAAAGLPLAGVGAIPGAMAGAGAMSIVKLLDSALGTDYLGQIMDRAGLPRPETPGERIASDVQGAIAGVPGAAGVGQALGSSSRQAVANIGNMLQQNLGTQTAAAATSAASAGATREVGGGPTAQFVAGVLGGMAPTAVESAARAIPNAVARSVQRSETRPFAREGQRLVESTGIDLPLGARTGNRLMLTMENQARQYPKTADRAQEVDVKIANQAIDRVNQLIKGISTNADDAEILGGRVEETVKQAATRLDAVRSKVADRDYGRVREIAGDQPVVELKNFTDELRRIISQYEGVVGADAQKIVAQAKSALNKATGVIEEGSATRVIETPTGRTITLRGRPDVEGPVASTIDEAMKSRSFYGKAARGGSNVFDDINPDTNRTLAARLFGAINRDFDESAANQGGALKTALERANGNFKKFSQSLEYLEKSALGKLIGDDLVDGALSGNKVSTTAGETIIKRIGGMEPSTRRTAMEIIGRWNPQLSRDLRANFLRNALEEGMAIPPSAKGASEVPISFAKFVSALGTQKIGAQKQMESYGFTKQEIADIRDTAVAMMRYGDKTGFNFSNTNVAGDAGEIASALGQAGASAASGSVAGAAKAIGGAVLKIAGKTVGFNKIVASMESEAGRAALRTIVSPKASPQAVIAAFETIESQ